VIARPSLLLRPAVTDASSRMPARLKTSAALGPGGRSARITFGVAPARATTSSATETTSERDIASRLPGARSPRIGSGYGSVFVPGRLSRRP
jgi:hypothetical protein